MHVQVFIYFNNVLSIHLLKFLPQPGLALCIVSLGAPSLHQFEYRSKPVTLEDVRHFGLLVISFRLHILGVAQKCALDAFYQQRLQDLCFGIDDVNFDHLDNDGVCQFSLPRSSCFFIISE